MDVHLEECLNGTEPGKYIFPFFWQHGEPHPILAEEINAIQQCGISEFCVESRVHPQFGKEQWWDDLGFIIQEAHKRGMRVWILDDKYFPSGYANGWIKEHPELRKVSLRLTYMDVAGPVDGGAVLMERLEAGESLVALAAWKRNQSGRFEGEPVSLMEMCSGGLIYLRLGEGNWRIFQVSRTCRSIPGKEDYIDLLSQESCRSVIHGVYEPHYQHFGQYFGNTLAGFFFDEPGFGNDEGTYSSKLGKTGMLIPWNDAILPRLAKKLGEKEEATRCLLPALWQEIEGKTASFRIAYMDLVTELVRKNYSRMLGEWCRNHGVLSVGHLIEDMNAHMRLGYGAGHYYRGMDGQDMAGMDIVLGQINPESGCDYPAAPVIGDCVDTAFFQYTLPKMTASCAHFSERKKGRAMCEIFGAYGWAEGLPMMKRLADRMLICGINYYVPHAFSPRYPDADCPPHFWARGNNPQYPYFKNLIAYMRRCCHMISDGRHIAQAVVLYHAKADWSGEDYFPMERLTRELAANQIDYDMIPAEELEKASFPEKKIKVGQETFSLLLVTDRAYWDEETIELMEKLQQKGILVWIIGEKKSRYAILEGMKYVSCDRIPKLLYDQTEEKEYLAEKEGRDIRILHIRRKKREIYTFFNESGCQEWSGTIQVEMDKGCLYDPWENKVYPAQIGQRKVKIHLFPGELLFLVEGEQQEINGGSRYDGGQEGEKLLKLSFRIEIWMESGWQLHCTANTLFDLTERRELSDYSGPIRYTGRFWLEGEESFSWIDLGRVGEIANVWLNRIDCGVRISPPYCYRIQNALQKGWNELVIEVVNNMAYRERDGFSRYFLLSPSGLLGPVRLKRQIKM